MTTLAHWLTGPPLPSQRIGDERLGNVRALAALSPDALASIAYANQEIFLALAVAGAAGLAFSLPIALAIAGLLGILALSYTQTISAYPSGGGSYTVARENLSVDVGLVAGAALMTDYVLNVAVSMTAGVEAIASAFPALWPHRVALSLLLLAAIAVSNLRGQRESGALVSVPVYLFLVTYLVLIIVGVVRAVVEGPGSLAEGAPPPLAPLTTLLVLRAFASGCTALTGVESISNGVPIFKPPAARHANQTMVAMAALMAVLFLGTVGLTQHFGVVAGEEETILSALTRRVVGGGPAYLLVQAATLLVLMVAGNTSFVGFPRVASIIARDGYLPRQLTYLGDRLVLTNGILVLAGLAGALIVLFGGDTHALIPLFAVGAFLAFTLSQAGMVVHWVRERGIHWRLKAAVNGLGVLATAAALGIIGVSKFAGGAWVVMLLIPLFVWAFHGVKRHYLAVAEELSLARLQPGDWPRRATSAHLKAVVPIAGLHRGSLAAMRFARSLTTDVTALLVDVDDAATQHVRELWPKWGGEVKLVVKESPYRSVIEPLLDYLDEVDQREPRRGLAVVVLPEFVPSRWWHNLLHNQTARVVKTTLVYRRSRRGTDRVLIDVPYHLHG